MTLRLTGQSEDAIHAHAHSSARLEEDFTKITLKPIFTQMHNKIHEQKRTVLKQSPVLFIFSEIERQIFEGVGFEKVCDSGSCVHDSYRIESFVMTHKI